MKFFQTIPLLLLTLFASAQAMPPMPAADQTLTWSRSKDWIRLLEYKSKVWGGWKTRAQSQDFFISPDGSHDPHAELKADVAELSNNSPSQLECSFPARFQWLRQKLALDEASHPKPACPQLQAFRDRMQAESISLVFSSYYVNNPSSAFGHLFLRVNRKQDPTRPGRHELFDEGINFAAETTTGNALLYAYFGLTGLFNGFFTHAPYFYKVREYGDFEARDLWEYQLNLTPEEVTRLIDHVWEMGPIPFRYYYLDDNCAYFILDALETAAPRLDLTDKLRTVVLPIDAVLSVTHTPGLAQPAVLRPSIRTQLQKRFSTLDASEEHAVKQIVSSQSLEPLKSLKTDESRTRALDTAIDAHDFFAAEKLLQQDASAWGWKNKLLGARSEYTIKPATLDFSQQAEQSPDLFHPTRRLTLMGGRRLVDKRALTTLEYRYAMHDALDPGAGAPPTLEMQVIKTALETDYHRVQLKRFDLVDVSSRTPWADVVRPPSWRFRLGSDRMGAKDCWHCYSGGLDFGAGVSWAPTSPRRALFTLMGDSQVRGSGAWDRAFLRPRIGGALIGTFQLIPDLWSLGLEARRLYGWNRERGWITPWKLETRFHVWKRALSLGFSAESLDGLKPDLLGGIYAYF